MTTTGDTVTATNDQLFELWAQAGDAGQHDPNQFVVRRTDELWFDDDDSEVVEHGYHDGPAYMHPGCPMCNYGEHARP